MRDELENVVHGASPKGFVVDMKRVEYVTSIAMLPFVNLRKTADEVGKRVVLCNMTDVVAKVLSVCLEPHSKVSNLQLANDFKDAVQVLRQSTT